MHSLGVGSCGLQVAVGLPVLEPLTRRSLGDREPLDDLGDRDGLVEVTQATEHAAQLGRDLRERIGETSIDAAA